MSWSNGEHILKMEATLLRCDSLLQKAIECREQTRRRLPVLVRVPSQLPRQHQRRYNR
jgi:hypothetical protein